jgi:hypothetical protein
VNPQFSPIFPRCTNIKLDMEDETARIGVFLVLSRDQQLF